MPENPPRSYRLGMRIFTRLVRCSRPALAAALVCLPALASPGCEKEKPNANRDIQKNRGELMDEMDKIAEKMEAEEKAKREKEQAPPGAPGATPDPEPKPAPDAPKPSQTPENPEKPAPPGGG